MKFAKVLTEVDNMNRSFTTSAMNAEKALELLQNTEEGRAIIPSVQDPNLTAVGDNEDEDVFADFRFKTFR